MLGRKSARGGGGSHGLCHIQASGHGIMYRLFLNMFSREEGIYGKDVMAKTSFFSRQHDPPFGCCLKFALSLHHVSCLDSM